MEETFEPGSSVARVARRYGVNANQVFQWRTLYRKGGLGGTPMTPVKLLPVPRKIRKLQCQARKNLRRGHFAGHFPSTCRARFTPTCRITMRALAAVENCERWVKMWPRCSNMCAPASSRGPR